MEFLRKYLAQIKAQLTGLTLSQRLLIGLLVVVMIGTIFFTVMFSAKPEMVQLIPQPMTAEELNRAEMALKGKYSYTVAGDRIMVPVEKAYQIRGELFASQALPKDTSQAFAKLMEDSDYLRSFEANARRWNFARQETLAKILRGFPYIDDANVIISKGEQQSLGRPEVPGSAMVTVKVRGGEALSANQVVAIVDMIRGAVAGLKREDVHITDGMRPYAAPSSDTPMPQDIMAWKKTIEDDLTKKLFGMLSGYGNVKIAVNVMPDMSQTTTQQEQFDPKPVKGEIRMTSHEEHSEDMAPGGQPGVQSNTTTVVGSTGSGKGSSMTNTQTTAESVVKIGSTQTRRMEMPGTNVKEMSASVALPRSFFVSLYHRKDPKADPTDEQLTGTIAECIKRLRPLAESAIGAKTDQLKMDWFDDMVLTKAEGGEGVGGVMASGGFMSFTQYAKQGALGAVALIALGMMLMMVRRVVPATAGAEADPSVFFGGKKKGEPGQFDTGDDVYGEAGSGDAVLTGIELDDETLQSRKMVDEVSIMIKENPENAAALVKRWLAKGK